MTTTAPIIPRSPLDRLRWAVADAWAVTLRDLTHWVHQPATVVVGLLFPVLMVLMFGYLFGGAMSVPGGGDYREFLLPGLFALTMVFGIEATIVAVTSDAAKGVTDRFRSMPMAPSAVVVGRCCHGCLIQIRLSLPAHQLRMSSPGAKDPQSDLQDSATRLRARGRHRNNL